MNMKKTKKITAIILSALLCGFTLVNPTALNTGSSSNVITANAATASGSCGNNLKWYLDGDTLKIAGSGKAINSYSSYGNNLAPWKKYSSQVKRIIFPNTLKEIGDYAFCGMNALETVSTADNSGLNKPCLPDLDKIGNYAFSNCYAMKGCTSNCKLTFGTGDASQTATLFIGDSAFENCDKIKFIESNYGKLKVDNYAFYSIDNLTSFTVPDTTIEMGRSVFLYCKKLSNVDYKPSNDVIHKTAFSGTPYWTNGCTQRSFSFGPATQLTGKQLVVNFFVDRTIVDLTNDYSESRVSTIRPNTEYHLKDGQIAASYYMSNTKSQSYSSTSVGIYNKKDMVSSYEYGWNVQKSNKTDNAAVTLNKFDFTNYSNNKTIPLDVVENGVTNGYFGSYVSSADIAERLNDVRSAMNDLKSQAEKYGSSFTYEMHPETNFHITYDFFDWNTKDAIGFGSNGQYLGYKSTMAYDVHGTNPFWNNANSNEEASTHINGNQNDVLFKKISDASKNLSGSDMHSVDLYSNSLDELSSYTNYLKNKYNVNSVIYLIHVNTGCQSETYHSENYGEFAIICKEANNSLQQRVIEHETAHLFSAVDFYSTSRNSDNKVKKFTAEYLPGELMTCQSNLVSPITAFFIGWVDRLHTPFYNIFLG